MPNREKRFKINLAVRKSVDYGKTAASPNANQFAFLANAWKEAIDHIYDAMDDVTLETEVANRVHEHFHGLFRKALGEK